MNRWKLLLTGLLLLNCLGIFWIWGTALDEGAFAEGIFTYQMEGNIPIFHLAAEFGMAILTAIGLIGWWRNRAWGRAILMLGLGMFTYSAINSMGWALVNDFVLVIPMVFTLLLVSVTVPMLFRTG
jgi:hypothetical protein